MSLSTHPSVAIGDCLQLAVPSVPQRPCGSDIRVSRIPRRIKGAHSVTIPGVASEPCVVEGCYIRADLSNLHEVDAVVALTPLYLEPGLIICVVGPTQIDLTG